jgi:hypothetical protein
MKKSFYSFASFLFILTGICVETNLACFVGPPSDRITNIRGYNFFVKDYNRATAIFLGKVIEREQFKVKFRVDKVWKGDIPREFVISSGEFPHEKGEGVINSSCSYEFKIGESYLVYADNEHFGNYDDPLWVELLGRVPDEYRNLLWVSQSSRTRTLAEAKLGIKNLNKLVEPKKIKH